MAVDHRLPGFAQPLRVELAFDVAEDLLEIRLRAFGQHQVQEHALLGGRQRINRFGLAIVHHRIPSRSASASASSSPSTWTWRSTTSAGAAAGRAAAASSSRVGAQEKVLGLEVETGAMGAGDRLNDHDRVAAQGEEVVAEADPLDPQNLLPDPGEGQLGGLLRRAPEAGGRRSRRRRRRQGLAVDLAVRGEREGRQLDVDRRAPCRKAAARPALSRQAGRHRPAAPGWRTTKASSRGLTRVAAHQDHRGLGDPGRRRSWSSISPSSMR